ncbi:MAG: hypothetical protein Kow00128_11990 [Deltaproteobacteria bacterium]
MELDVYPSMSQVSRMNMENGRTFGFPVLSNSRKKNSFQGIHPSPLFHALIEKERARAERTGVKFSLACFDVSKLNGTAMDALRRLAATLEGRTRDTDEVGWFDDSCIGVLLAGTGEDGARIYAKDIQSKSFDDSAPVECRVYTYPSLWFSSKGNGNGSDHLDLPRQRKEGGNGSSMDMKRAKEPPETLHELVSKKMPAWKRAIDILGSATGLILLSPLFLLVAALIKIVSPGPVFFRQDRVGHAGKLFTFLKFRTMHVNNDATVHKQYLSTLIRGDQAMEKLDADRDPRIIRFGRFLRQSCIDELPQLINVFRGDMSLVGPRPCLPYEAQEYLLWHARRFDTVPGMTGLWQVNGKNKTTFKEMIRYDIAYSRQMSPWLDFSILLKTIPTVFSLVMEHLRRKRAASASPHAALINRAS